MHNLTDFEWLSLFTFLVLWWVNPFDGKWMTSKKARKRYKDVETSIPKLLPGWIYGLIWFLLYTLVAVALWLYLNHAPQAKDDRTLYDATIALGLIVNYVLVKSFYYVFYKRGFYTFGVFHAILVCLTALATEAMMWIHFDSNGNVITAAILYAPYALYTIWVVIRSIDVAFNNTSQGFFSKPYDIVGGVDVEGTPIAPTSTSRITPGTQNSLLQSVRSRWNGNPDSLHYG